METIELYSKRKKMCERRIGPVSYQYDILPQPFRNQVKHIFRDWRHPIALNEWASVGERIIRDHGLPPSAYEDLIFINGFEWCRDYLYFPEIDKVLDLIELVFRCIEDTPCALQRYEGVDASSSIAELNGRFREHSLGYRFINGCIIRCDSEFAHAKITKPVLTLIHETEFQGAESEFMKAHQHYKNSDYEGALVESYKALESTLKSICDHKGWKYEAKATAKSLINIVFENGLIPKCLQAHGNHIRATLETGVPALRNTMAAHGQGRKSSPVPQYIAEYALNLTASSISLLIKAYKS